ncbi:hypothetical protein L6452_33106 [Arctium lappa]|uniref:Uncharacterized protein n=1 Tax=Arctium lappa TaxID=4217 RepID=A0ACB8Z7D4_ARCLA|nr:hypothetical protein L6452_33106 [Arctium lappa]
MQSRKHAHMVANRQAAIVSDYELMKSSSSSKQAPVVFKVLRFGRLRLSLSILQGAFLEPAVQVLAVHLEKKQRITFKKNQPLQNIANNPMAKKTTLTQWHWRKMSDNITQKATQTSNVTGLYLNDEDLQNHLLYELEILLNSNSNSSSLSEFGLPMPPAHLLTNLQNRLLMEEKNYDRIKLAEEHKALQLYLNTEQQKVYDLIMKASSENKQELIFVYGHGGTGKTFLWTTITFALRAAGKIVLAVASSGIASLLLPSGRTTHSRFKIPLDITNEALCHIQKNTQLAQLLIETSLIIWDEAPMNDRKCFEAVDKTLRDILNEPTHPFGGKSVLLGGDFRQTLPIKPKGTKMDIIAASIVESSLWKHFNIHKLSQNMRLHRPNLTSEEKEKVSEFSSGLLKIGDGQTGISDENDPTDTKWVEIPNEYMIHEYNESLMQLVRFIYNDEALQNPTTSMLCDRAIVCPKNNTADEINDLILDMLPGQKSVYLSVDSVIPHANEKGDTKVLYPPQYLNLLNFNGFPKHRLELKVGAPIMNMSVKIAQTADLKPGDGDRPIDIKVLRSWTPYGKRNECCFLLIDKQGNPIQAYANSNDKSQFQTPIKVGSCYRVTNFICEKSRTYMVIVPHKTSIRVGKAARFEEIPDTGFPLHYFNFSPYDQLSNKMNKHEILTAETSLHTEATTVVESPTIVAVTSMKVTKYYGRTVHMQSPHRKNRRQKRLCNTMVEQHGYTNPEMLPTPLTAVVGAPKIFQMRYNKSSKPGAIDFVMDRVFDDATPATETNTSSKRISQDDIDDRKLKRSTNHQD